MYRLIYKLINIFILLSILILPFIFQTVSAANLAVQFDGTNQRIKMGNKIPALGKVFTVEVFFMWTGDGSNQYHAVIERQWYGKQEWGIFFNRDNGQVGATVNYDGNHAGSQSVWLGENGTSSIIVKNKWNHVALEGNGTIFSLYLNGKLVNTQTESAAPLLPSNPIPEVSVGGLDEGATAEPMQGTANEFRISNTARYSGSAYIIPTQQFDVDSNTIGLWHMNEGSGNKTLDQTSNHYDGTFNSIDTPSTINWTTGYIFSNTSPTALPITADPCIKKVNGDINCDGKIDNSDIQMWEQDFISHNLNSDVNNDGKTDLSDFEAIRQNNIF